MRGDESRSDVGGVRRKVGSGSDESVFGSRVMSGRTGVRGQEIVGGESSGEGEGVTSNETRVG